MQNIDDINPDISSEDGVKYYGDTIDILTGDGSITKVSHGYGIIKWPDGTVYEGNWVNGLK